MPRTFRQFLEAHRAAIGRTCYPGVTADEIIADVLRVSRTERGAAIALCDPRSILDAVCRAAAWPLEIGGREGSALIVSREVAPNGRPRLEAMQTARGKLRILKQCGVIMWYNANPVYANEPYVEHQGSTPGIDHQSLKHDIHGRGALIGAYADAIVRPSLPHVVVALPRHEIDEIRQQWSQDFSGGDLEDYPWYPVTRAVHRLCSALTMPLKVKALIDDAPAPKTTESDSTDLASEGTVSVPVSDPRGVIDSIAKPVGPPNRVIIEGQQPPSRSTRQPREFASL